MVDREGLRRRFRPLEGRVLAVLLWGSHAQGEATTRSDVDICLVAGPDRDPVEVLREAWRMVDPRGLELDFQVFEALPLWLKIKVMEDHEVIWTEDEPTLGEYWFPHWRIWRDQAHRQQISDDEMDRLLGRA